MSAAGWVLIATIDDIPERGARRFCSRSGPVVVFRTSDDEIFALADRCPHRGGPLSEGIVSGRTVTCPLHNWILDLATGEACEPDEGRAASIPLKIEGRDIFIDGAAVSGVAARPDAAE